jgi:hypothetical protein
MILIKTFQNLTNENISTPYYKWHDTGRPKNLWEQYKKYEHYSKIYTDRSKKEEKVKYAVMLNESTIKIRQFPQNSTYSAEESAIINAI